jgi:hypothetical protein
MKFAALLSSPDAGVHDNLQQIPDVPVTAPRCLLLGPARRRAERVMPTHQVGRRRWLGSSTIYAATPRSGKTSLLFNYAYQAAAKGAAVLFVSVKHKLALSPPMLPPGVERSDPAFTRIHMKCAALPHPGGQNTVGVVWHA